MIKKIKINKIKNSKKEETVEITIFTNKGTSKASAPSGTSAGKHEVKAYNKNINNSIKQANKILQKLIGQKETNQKEIDSFLKENMKKIGGSISIATSIATARAGAKASKKQLYEYVNKGEEYSYPIMIGKCIGGGVHAKNSTTIQEFLSIPLVKEMKKAVKINRMVHRKTGAILKNFKGFQKKLDYEGGWVANISDENALGIVSSAIEEVSKKTKADIALGIDVAASEFWNGKKYVYKKQERTPKEHYDFIKYLIKEYDLYYIEDPFQEDDFKNLSKLTKKFKNRMIVGDDTFTTNPRRLKKGIKLKAANSVLIKPNQIGTLTETYETVKLAKKHAYTPVISHRSGETKDSAIADLAVGWGIPFIKIGIIGKEREAKTNRIIKIEKVMKWKKKKKMKRLKQWQLKSH